VRLRNDAANQFSSIPLAYDDQSSVFGRLNGVRDADGGENLTVTMNQRRLASRRPFATHHRPQQRNQPYHEQHQRQRQRHHEDYSHSSFASGEESGSGNIIEFGSSTVVVGGMASDAMDRPNAALSANSTCTTIVLSNLHWDITEPELKVRESYVYIYIQIL
jgi:hypothetical protein